MKSEKVIDETEKSLPEEMRKCRYCRGDPVLYTRRDRSYEGIEGFVATVRCKCCGTLVFAFGLTKRAAKVMARSYWEKGIRDN